MLHTPGPWHEVTPNPPELWDTRIFAGTRYIGMIGNSDNADGCDAANAKLISAAPDLLAASMRALNYIENTECELGLTLESGDMLRAAIAKAKGV